MTRIAFTLTGRSLAPGFPRSQWRDRSGVSPGSLSEPTTGHRQRSGLYVEFERRGERECNKKLGLRAFCSSRFGRLGLRWCKAGLQ